MCKLGVLSQERLKIDVKFYSVLIGSHMPRRLTQRMTLSDLERPFHGSAARAISAIAELFVTPWQRHARLSEGRVLLIVKRLVSVMAICI